jgi:hypothetical protein
MFYCVFLQHLVLPSAISFVCCQIHFGKFFSLFLHNVLVKEARLVVTVDDLDFKIWDVAFEAKVLNRYGTFDWIENRSMEDPCYAYLHCDLLDRATLTIITLKVKSPYIKMHEQHLQKGMFILGGKICHWVKVWKRFWEGWHACCHHNWSDNHCVINSSILIWVNSNFFSHGFVTHMLYQM